MDRVIAEIEEDRENGPRRGIEAALRFVQRERRIHTAISRSGSMEDYMFDLALGLAERAIKVYWDECQRQMAAVESETTTQ